MSSIEAVLTCTRELALPWQRVLGGRERSNITILTTSLLPFFDISVVNEVAMQPKPELERKMDDGEWARRNLLGVQDHNIVPQSVEMIDKSDEIAFTFCATLFRDEGWFLEGRSWPLQI